MSEFDKARDEYLEYCYKGYSDDHTLRHNERARGADWAHRWCQKNKIFEPYGDFVARKDKQIEELTKEAKALAEALLQLNNYHGTTVMGTQALEKWAEFTGGE